MIFKKFFVVSGTGLSRTSRLNAFDKALMQAGISQCNLVPVSSILPKKAKQIEPKKIEPGTITFVVMARIDDEEGKTISAGLGWALCEDAAGKESYGIVVEEKGAESEAEVRQRLTLKLKEATESRGLKIKKQEIKTAHIGRVPQERFGSAVVALVYTN